VDFFFWLSHQNLNVFLFSQIVLYAQPSSSFFIWSFYLYPAKSTSYEAPHYATVSNLPSVHSSSVRIFSSAPINKDSRDSAVGIAAGYGLDDQEVGVQVPVGSRFFTSPCYPERLWGPLSLISNGYRGLFPRGWTGRGVKLTTHLHLVPRSRKCGPIHPLPHTPSWRSA
jgi:hypothetical protein